MQKKHVVKLSEEERAYLLEIMNNGQATQSELRRGGILLKLDENEENNTWTQTTIAEAHGRKRYAVIALACSPPPEEKLRWTAQLLADESVRQGFIKSISSSSVLIILQKVDLSYCPFAPKKLPRKKRSLADT